MEGAVERAVAAAFPERTVSTRTVAPRSDRPGNRTVRLQFTDDSVAYLKVAVDDQPEARARLAREAAAIAYASEHTAVRVPQVLAADTDGTPAYVATAALSGTVIATDWPAGSAVARATVLRAVGRALADVHTARFDEHAVIHGGTADDLTLDRGSWTDVLTTTLEDRATELFADRFRDHNDQLLDALRDSWAVLDDAPATLVHDDPRPENCLVDSAGPGLVDWETAMIGDPALDVTRAEAQYVERADVDQDGADRLRRALRAGYRDHAGTLPDGFGDRYPIYRAVTFLDTARTFEYWAPNADEPADDLATWVDAEFESRLGALPAD